MFATLLEIVENMINHFFSNVLGDRHEQLFLIDIVLFIVRNNNILQYHWMYNIKYIFIRLYKNETL